MREHGYLGPELGLGTVADILARKSPPSGDAAAVSTATSNDLVIDIIERLKAGGYSQLPVVDDGNLSGLISEVDLLNYMVSGEADPQHRIGDLLDRDFALVEPSTSAALLSELFSQGKVIVVMSNGKVTGIVTKIDLIDHIKEALR